MSTYEVLDMKNSDEANTDYEVKLEKKDFNDMPGLAWNKATEPFFQREKVYGMIAVRLP